MDQNLQVILQQLQAEKSIERDALIEAIRSAIETAARKSFPPNAHLAVEVDPSTLAFKIFQIRTVVEEVEDPDAEISLEEARQLNPNATAGARLKLHAPMADLGRIAAQTAKQVIIQKLKDAERDNVYEEFKNRQGELITGIVKRVSHGNVIVSVGRAEAMLPHREQSPRENYKPGDRIRAYVYEVDKNARGPQVVLSRASAELVRSLFEVEVPEIYDGTIEIKGIAREAGNRTKIAVQSNDPNVDAVGACVGMKGSRVRSIVEELHGEKIDILRWSEDPQELCANALNPADIVDISFDSDNKVMLVVVPHDQLSLAIGKRGQNARLASRLMGWTVDIKSDVQLTGGDLENVSPAEALDRLFGEGGEEAAGEEQSAAPAEGEAEAGASEDVAPEAGAWETEGAEAAESVAEAIERDAAEQPPLEASVEPPQDSAEASPESQEAAAEGVDEQDEDEEDAAAGSA
jgi:N utilization substance protein A